MKIRRQKQAKHLLSSYRNFFGITEPYRILIDGTFTKVALQYNIQIRDQLGKYLNGEVHCFTTRCVLAELELLGSQTYGAKLIAQRFKIHSCSHRKKPIAAVDCLKSILNNDNPRKFFLASQDRSLTKLVRSVAGIPLLYAHQNNIVFDKLSKLTQNLISDISQGKAVPTRKVQTTIQTLKQEANLLPEAEKKKKRKYPKGPNPLSCKKSKKLKLDLVSKKVTDETTEQKRKHKRVRNRKSHVISVENAS